MEETRKDRQRKLFIGFIEKLAVTSIGVGLFGDHRAGLFIGVVLFFIAWKMTK